MPALFDRHGVRFSYPENWLIDESPLDEGWSVAVQSPGSSTAFLILSAHTSRPPVKDVLDITLAALREDYPDLEADEAGERIAGHQAKGYDIQFFSLDLVNSCWVRSFRTADATILILSQASDLELDAAEPVLRAIRASLQITET